MAMVTVCVCVLTCMRVHVYVSVCWGRLGTVWVPLCPPSCKKMGSLSFQGEEDLEAENNRKCSVWNKFPSVSLKTGSVVMVTGNLQRPASWCSHPISLFLSLFGPPL